MIEAIEIYWPHILAIVGWIGFILKEIKERISIKELRDSKDQLYEIRDEAGDGGKAMTFEEGLDYAVDMIERLSTKEKKK